MIRIALPAISVLALAACAPATKTPPRGPGEQPAAYMALGTEPGWTLEITPSRLNYDGDYGETKIMVPNPGAKPSFNGERYVTERLTVDITHAGCSDGMSDRRYRDTVTVTADGKTVKGCGGKILPPTGLAGTNWTFVSIGGTPVVADRPTALQFDGDRLSGSAGCNRFSGTYSVDGSTLKAADGDRNGVSGHGVGTGLFQIDGDAGQPDLCRRRDADPDGQRGPDGSVAARDLIAGGYSPASLTAAGAAASFASGRAACSATGSVGISLSPVSMSSASKRFACVSTCDSKLPTKALYAPVA